MRAVKVTMLVTAVVCLLGANDARACGVIGKFVCRTDPTIGVGGVAFTVAGPDYTATGKSCSAEDVANGVPDCMYVGFFFTHVDFAGDYTLDPGGLTAYCGPPDYVIDYGEVPIDDAVACPTTEKPADCSPGYYKKHPSVWSTQCVAFYSPLVPAGTQDPVAYIVWMLSAEKGATLEQREAAKSALDACFGTAENSPCFDDDL